MKNNKLMSIFFLISTSLLIGGEVVDEKHVPKVLALALGNDKVVTRVSAEKMEAEDCESFEYSILSEESQYHVNLLFFSDKNKAKKKLQLLKALRPIVVVADNEVGEDSAALLNGLYFQREDVVATVVALGGDGKTAYDVAASLDNAIESEGSSAILKKFLEAVPSAFYEDEPILMRAVDPLDSISTTDLITGLSNPDVEWFELAKIVVSAGNRMAVEAVPALSAIVANNDYHPHVRNQAIKALAKIGDKRSLTLLRSLDSPNAEEPFGRNVQKAIRTIGQR